MTGTLGRVVYFSDYKVKHLMRPTYLLMRYKCPAYCGVTKVCGIFSTIIEYQCDTPCYVTGVVAIETQDTVKVEVWDVVDKGENICDQFYNNIPHL